MTVFAISIRVTGPVHSGKTKVAHAIADFLSTRYGMVTEVRDDEKPPSLDVVRESLTQHGPHTLVTINVAHVDESIAHDTLEKLALHFEQAYRCPDCGRPTTPAHSRWMCLTDIDHDELLGPSIPDEIRSLKGSL